MNEKADISVSTPPTYRAERGDEYGACCAAEERAGLVAISKQFYRTILWNKHSGLLQAFSPAFMAS